MSEPDDGRTLRDVVGRVGDSGATEVTPPDTVRDSSIGVPKIGETIAEKYLVDREIGAGGMGQVLAVRHVKLDQLFAMKVLDPELVDDEDARARFGREARAMAALTSPYTVRVHDVAELPNKLPYLVMDYLDGEDLGRTLRRRGPLSVDETVSLIDQACQALEEAHAAGLVHRDLKPQNLFLAKDAKGNETVRVLDFGIARAVGGGKIGKLQTITRHGDVLGTLEYMAPEQIRSARSVDPRTDVWALGACLYRMLTNARPFVAGGQAGLVEAILQQEPHAIREINPDVPAALVFVVQRCLKKNPAERFASVKDLRAALQLARVTNDIPEDDGTVPMTRAPMRPLPVPAAGPQGTLPMAALRTHPPAAATPAPAPSGPSLSRPHPPPVAPRPSTPAPQKRPARLPLVALVAIAVAIGVVLALIGLRLMQR